MNGKLTDLACICAALTLSGCTSGPVGTTPSQAALGTKSGVIEYEVTTGENRPAGLTKIVEQFDLAPGRYKLVRTLLSAERRNVFTSEGGVEGDRLVPKAFYRDVNGVRDFTIEIGERGVSVWKASGAPESWPRPEAPIDFVSAVYQAASVTKDLGSLTLTQVHVYGVESKKISYVGEETLATPLGVERVIHLRSETSAAVEDIWIAPGRRNMPVKFTIPAGRQVLIATVTKLEFR